MYRRFKTKELDTSEINNQAKEENDIYVVDAIMGAGKTSAAINYINNSADSAKFIFVTPYLKEVDRIIESCKVKGIIAPNNDKGSKMKSFINLIENNKNIVCTHELFNNISLDMVDLITSHGYILILDEVADVVDQLKVSQTDFEIITQQLGHVDSNGLLCWDDEFYDGKLIEYKNAAMLDMIYVYDNKLDGAFIRTFPVSIFKSFTKVFILTYMFNGQIQRCYYDMFKVKYKYIYIENKNGEYFFEDNIYDTPQYHDITKIKKNIEIIDDYKLNLIGTGTGKYIQQLSKSWYNRQSKKSLKILNNNTYNFFHNICKTPSELNMWTTFKEYKEEISDKGYTKGFISCNARATNEYINKISCAYLINIYYNPYINKFLKSKGISINEDAYALSEMLQWLFRSGIRQGNKIKVYIPSQRMRELFFSWEQ